QNPKVSLPKTQQTRQVFQFSPERRTSSLAAPPPSSVSGLIEEHLRHSQQHQKKKKKKNGKWLIWLGYFGFSLKSRLEHSL
ncbi:hypothetical protein, partial [Agrobacterium rosae]|uniref:hypothetical protein n=3 Tax=Agrobacterium rosae TaxID=1972867 RepID=UPI003BA15562